MNSIISLVNKLGSIDDILNLIFVSRFSISFKYGFFAANSINSFLFCNSNLILTKSSNLYSSFFCSAYADLLPLPVRL